MPNATTNANETPAAIMDPLDLLLAAIESETARGPCQVRLYRTTPEGRRAPVTLMNATDFDPFAVGEKWGGGPYFAQLTRSGTILKSASFDAIGAPPAVKAPTITPAAAPSGGTDMMGILAAMIQTQGQQAISAQAQMTTLLTTVLAKDTGPKFGDLIALIKDTGPKSTLKELMELAAEMRGDAPAREGDEGEGKLAGVLEKYGPAILAAFAGPRPSPPQPARPTSAPPQPALPAATVTTGDEISPPEPALSAQTEVPPELADLLADLPLAELRTPLEYALRQGLDLDLAAELIECAVAKLPALKAEKARAMLDDNTPADIAKMLRQFAPELVTNDEDEQYVNAVLTRLTDEDDAPAPTVYVGNERDNRPATPAEATAVTKGKKGKGGK